LPPPGARFFIFLDKGDRLGGARLNDAAEADDALPADLHAVAAHEQLLALARHHERTVGGLVDQQEAIAAHFDPRVQPRNQVALHHEVILVAAPERGVRALGIDRDFL
jgi:hypothetical protein